MLIYSIVKEHVDRLDRMGLLDMGAPKDEYDIESRMISERITEHSTADEIAQIMADVFGKMLSQKESKERYAQAAQQIFEDLHP